ncbi:polysaccharide deacetylase family protein [Agathobaculum desmolans]|uniref:polysaccharide deacetylase family protein n=1 Tax=Agathobaculum desmolans TaxID=39484 RepID=UPI0004E28A90|nr:polysaccharide deacetylase family protein [Agathobaculum desmolans]
MPLGFRKVALQAVGTVLVLCGLIVWLDHGAAQPVWEEQETVELPILMYHSILKDSARQGKYVVSPTVLAADLDALQQRGYRTVTVSDLLAFVQQGAPLPEKPVMITFDDGYYNNYVYAYPLLQQRGMRAVVSIIGAQTDLYTQNGTENAYWSHLRLDRLCEMQDVFEVQNHSWNLHEYGARRGCLRRQDESEETYGDILREDTAQTQRLLSEARLPVPQCYTYPFGACSAESEQILQEMGFACTLGCEEKINTVTRDPACLYQMGRFNRAAGEGTEIFLNRVLEG